MAGFLCFMNLHLYLERIMLQDIHREDAAMKSETEIKGKGAEPSLKAAQKGALPYSEKQLLRGLNPETSHADELAEPTIHELRK